MTGMRYTVSAILAIACCAHAQAGEAEIGFATLEAREDTWTVSVTLRHGDTGWEHYADEWRVVDDAGNVLGRRVLAHPHVDEQPFTRSASGIRIPAGTARVYIEAHDTVHGWSTDRLEVDLGRATGGRYRVSSH